MMSGGSFTTPSTAAAVPRRLKVLTLNVWGLAFFSKARDVRLAAIATRLAASDYDVVALQEIWCESSDWKELRSRCSARFSYSKFFYSGAFGSGLAVLSRFPIVSSHTHPYTLNGHPIMVHHGDWVVAKAAGCATLDVKGLGHVDVWVTHTIAAGGEDGPEAGRAHRITQAYELANFVRTSAGKGHHVICLGDFNSTPPSLSIAILRDIGHLTDAYLQSHPQLAAHAVALPNQTGVRPDPRRCLAELGITCDSPLNTWTAGKPLDERAKRGAGKRLDYVFFRGPAKMPNRTIDACRHARQGKLRCVDSSVTFVDLIESHGISYSDHFGLEAIFEISPKEGPDTDEGDDHTSTQYDALVSQTLTSSLSALASAIVAARHRQLRTWFLFLGLLIVGLFCIGLSASSRGGAFSAFCTLTALICGWTGSTALYGAVIWGEWEKRSLRTFLEAMEMELSSLRGAQPSSPTPQANSSPAPSPRIGHQAGTIVEDKPSRKMQEQQQQQQRLINVESDSE